MKFAEVAVNSSSALRRTFSYSIPPDLELSVGQAVWVPFGPRRLQGIVLQLTDEPAVAQTKDIAALLDSRPVLFPHQVELARWISHTYLSSPFEAASLMLPPGFERRLLTFFQPAEKPSATASLSLTPDQRKVLALLRQQGQLELGELKKVLGSRKAEAVTAQLVRKGLATKRQELERIRVRPKQVRQVRLAVDADRASQEASRLEARRALRQAELLRLLVSEGRPLAVSEIGDRFSAQLLKALQAKGLIAIDEVVVSRDPLAHRTFESPPPPEPTPAQQAVWREINEETHKRASAGAPGQSPAVFLLHGVTGSGKTEIYLRALEQTISLGKQGIVLVPEIALTPQTINRFASRFPGRTAVLHSKLSLGEQFDEWMRIRDGEFDVVIGSRGAVFAPLPRLGLIVIDEEHEWTYKQHEGSPRYHARQVAIKLAELTGAVVVLGSATPDVESYYRAERGEFRLVRLLERVGGAAGSSPRLPEVEVIDLRQELRRGNRSIFSRALYQAMELALAAGEQIILFLNRRGAATFVQCRDCGYVMRCRRCDVALTYHASGADLVCHLCNHRMKVPQVCPNCWSRRIKFLGLGTQKVEEEVKKIFPEAGVLRWDRDVTRGKHSHEMILAQFLEHKADILVGTQMIAKGLDMPLVTLVGVINADVNLHLPEFRAGERTFQLMTQVAGRAGRGALGGRVILQTYNPENYAITAAARHDYEAFYQVELSLRRQFHNPPFSRLAALLYAHTNAVACQREAERFYRVLKEERASRGLTDTVLLGPAPAYTERLRGRYRWQIVIRSPDPLGLLSELTIPRGWVVDIDPASLL